jgi:hypothetical protein
MPAFFSVLLLLLSTLNQLLTGINLLSLLPNAETVLENGNQTGPGYFYYPYLEELFDKLAPKLTALKLTV